MVIDYIRDPSKSVEDLPTYYEDILPCVHCTIDLEAPGKTALWTWYCDELVPHATGYADAFGVNLRCFERIPTSHLPNLSNSLRVPPSTGAFIDLAFDGYI